MGQLRAAIALLSASAILGAPAAAGAAHSVGSAEQIAWVRRAAANFVAAELKGNGEGACAVLNRPLRTSVHGRTCAQRWDARIAEMIRRPGERARIRAQARAIPTAVVVVRGNAARIELRTPLINGPNRFLWNEMCWMLTG